MCGAVWKSEGGARGKRFYYRRGVSGEEEIDTEYVNGKLGGEGLVETTNGGRE